MESLADSFILMWYQCIYHHYRDILDYLDRTKNSDKMSKINGGRAVSASNKSQLSSTSSKPSSTLSQPSSAVSKIPSYTDLPISEAKMEHARRAVESKRFTPHFYMTADIQLPSWLLNRGRRVDMEGMPGRRGNPAPMDGFFSCTGPTHNRK